jgi:D-alanyl-D-alanine carboxypeptidase
MEETMKIRLLLLALVLLVFTGCTMAKSEPISIKRLDTEDIKIDEEMTTELKTEVSEDAANKSTQDKESITDTIEDISIEEITIIQTPFIVTADDVNGYHELITDVNDINLGLDLSDPRLSDLVAHLSNYTYNTQIHQIGEVTVPDSLFVLTNKLNHLPEDYTPETLRVPEIRFSFSEYNEKKNQRVEPALALEAMFADAEAEFHYLFAVSGYRSYKRQNTIYNYKAETRGVDEADKVSARPGHSEHQTGLAMDITSEAVGFGLEYAFGDTTEGIWVAENAHNYGFIIRYPETKVDITGYNYEPWHLRYIGEDLASYIYENQLTLEELYSSIFNQLQE